MSRPFLAAAFLIASLAACQAEGTGAPAPEGSEPAVSEEAAVMPDQPNPAGASTSQGSEPDDSGCGADKLARWLNVLPTGDVKAEIAATVGQRAIRYIGPGDAVTLDFSLSRLNVELGEDGRIKLFRCG